MRLNYVLFKVRRETEVTQSMDLGDEILLILRRTRSNLTLATTVAG